MMLDVLVDIRPDGYCDCQCQKQQQNPHRSVCGQGHSRETESGADGVQNRDSLLLVQSQIHQFVVEMSAVRLERTLPMENAAAERKNRV